MQSQNLRLSLVTVAVAAALGTGQLVDRAATAAPQTITPVATAQAAPAIGETMDRTALYFGTDKPGKDVADAAFQVFVNGVITPRFPEGLTVHKADGQFKNSQGAIVKERSYVVVLFYPPSPAANIKIEKIRAEYERRFQQESVLRADSTDRISF
ncbi:MAG: DUF3574 domain-containing protein [Tetrasphaera sp.]